MDIFKSHEHHVGQDLHPASMVLPHPSTVKIQPYLLLLVVDLIELVYPRQYHIDKLVEQLLFLVVLIVLKVKVLNRL